MPTATATAPKPKVRKTPATKTTKRIEPMPGEKTHTTQMLPVAQTVAGNNDRTVFDQAAIEDLAGSIKAQGLLAPIVVRKMADADVYQIIAGERRFRAIKFLNWAWYSAVILNVDDEAASELMLVENTARMNLDIIDEARAYQSRIDRFGWSADEIAQKAGVSGSRVRSRLKLNRLDQTVQQLTRSGQLPLGYAQLLADCGLESPEQLTACRIFGGEKRPTLEWFRGIVSKLQECQQTALTMEFELEMQIQQTKPVTASATRLPRPLKHKAPVVGATALEVIGNQIDYWRKASGEWNSLNSKWIAEECDTAVKVLLDLQETLAATEA